MRCETVIGLLPWYLNRSLDRGERGSVGAHLDDCSACRRDLAATARAGWLYGAHLPTDTLVGLAFGDLGPEEQAAAERHVAQCPSCRAELALAEGSAAAEAVPEEVREQAPPARRGHPSPWLLAAAMVVAAILLAGVVALWQADRGTDRWALAAPRADHPVLELLPEELVLRAGEGEPAAGRISPEAGPVTVLLSAPGVAGDRAYRIELREGDATLWRSEPTAPDRLGGFSLLVPSEALAEGVAFVVLPGDAAEGAEPVATYRLR